MVSAWSGGHKWKLSFSRCRRREPGDHWPPGRHSPCPPPAVSPPWTRGSLSPPACQVIIGESSNSEMHSWITRSDRDVWRSPCPDTSTVSRTEVAYKEILEVALTLNLLRPPHQTREPLEVRCCWRQLSLLCHKESDHDILLRAFLAFHCRFFLCMDRGKANFEGAASFMA